MTDSEPTVFAVVLTFDAPEQAERCVRCLQRQTVRPREIVVVDNHSRDRPDPMALQATGDIPVRILRQPENLGPAGGHAVGMTEFLDTGFDYVWEINDTVEPDDDCLAQLLDEMGRHGGRVHVHPAMYTMSTGEREDHWGFYGVLVPRAGVENAGVPMTELFFALEDTEYLRDRLPLAGFPGVRAERARVRVALRPEDVRRPAWKYYYESRNRVYLYVHGRRHIRTSTRIKSLVYVLVGEVQRVLRLENHRPTKISYLLLGIVDGLLGRLGRTVTPGHTDRPWKLEAKG